MKVARAAAALLFMLLLLALPGRAGAQGAAVITGTLNYRNGTTLPANAVVTVQVAKVTPGVAPQVVAAQRFTTNGAQPPFRFSLSYDPARIEAGSSYTLQANITVAGQTRYTTTTLVPVITNNSPTRDVAVTLSSTGRLPNTGAGALPLLLAGAAALAALGLRAVRRA